MTALIPALWREHVSRSSESPSRRHNVSAERELSELQGVANFIQEVARKLSLPLICINTAIVYTQRFYLFHSLTLFEKYCLGASALFLAAKVEDHPRKVENFYHVVKLLGRLNKEVSDTQFIDDILFNENIILQTLGFEIYIEHPHTHVVRLCDFLNLSKPFSQTAYILATYCLQLTRMCLFHKPGIVACLCIRMTSKIMNETPQGRDGKNWYQFGDPSLTVPVLDGLCKEFLDVIDTCPPQWKNKTLFNNHQNLANKMVLSSTGLPMFGEGASNSDSDLSNMSLSSVKLSDRMERVAQTPGRSMNTPQTFHRFTDVPLFGEVKRSSSEYALNRKDEQKPSTSSHFNFSSISQMTPKKSVENHQHVKNPSSAEKRKLHSMGKTGSSDEKAHNSRSLLKPNAHTEQKHPPERPTQVVYPQNVNKYPPMPKNHQPSHSEKHYPTYDKKHNPRHSNHHQPTVPKPLIPTEKKLPTNHLLHNNHHQLSSNVNRERVQQQASFQKIQPSASYKPKEQQRPNVSRHAHNSETKTHQNHRRHESSSKPVSSASSHRALPVSYSKTEESQPDKKIVLKDYHQRKTSHSLNQTLPALDSWSPASLDFTCLSDSYSDFDPWGALVNKDLSPKYHPIPRNPSLGSTSSGMNLLKITNTESDSDRRRSSAPVPYDFGDHFAKRFKSN